MLGWEARNVRDSAFFEILCVFLLVFRLF